MLAKKTSLFLILICLLFTKCLWADESSKSKEESKETLQVSPSIIPLPYQTIQNAGLNRGLSQSFCESFGSGLVGDVRQCSSMGCYEEQEKDNRQTNLLPSKVFCYQCLKLSSEEGCCPGMPVYADKSRGESCAAKTGSSCSESRTCAHHCPANSKLVPGTPLTRSVECCKCSSPVSGKCDDGGTERSTSCSEGNLSDIRYQAADASDCSNLVVRGGGQCLPKCIGEGVECGAAQ